MDTKTTSAKNTEWKRGEAAGRWERRRLYDIARQAVFWWTFLESSRAARTGRTQIRILAKNQDLKTIDAWPSEPTL
jgi:hypothetical protein